jgi:predicted permease
MLLSLPVDTVPVVPSDRSTVTIIVVLLLLLFVIVIFIIIITGVDDDEDCTGLCMARCPTAIAALSSSSSS